MRFLLFTLYAPMGSFGEVAVGERRMGWVRPGRSAVLGMVAAAQGIDRVDEDGHRALEEGLHFAVRTDAAGQPLIDYHTAQTPRSRKGRRFRTRREELASPDLHTVLSQREWRTDTHFTVALWVRQSGAVDLDEVASALQRPRYTLYLGRKSAPLGLPLAPGIVEADTFLKALGKRGATPEQERILGVIRGETQPSVAFDADAAEAPVGARIERRRDAMVHRGRWQFGERLEGVVASGDGS